MIYKRTQIICQVDLLEDSRASINIMSESIAKKNHLPYEKAPADSFDIKDAQGEQIPITGKVKLRLKIEGCNQFFFK